jgi:phage nucleotide-binding protein
MGLIKKPSELDVKQTLTAMIYGQPGIGKTTLACSAPAPILMDFDGGVTRVNGAHQCDTVQVTSWEMFQQALTEVSEAGDTYKTIIIDTIGKLLAYMEDYIKRTQPKMKQLGGSLSRNGYGMRKQMFIQLLKDASTWHKNIVFVAHETEQKRGDEIIIRPEISGSAANELVKELDLVGYMQAYGNNRTITFDPTDRFYGKNTCNMGGIINIPIVVDANGKATGSNDFLCRVVESYQARQRDNIEQTAKYEKLMHEIKEQADAVETAEDANKMIEWLKTCDHVYNSPAIAWGMLQERGKALGLKYNKSAKKYAV